MPAKQVLEEIVMPDPVTEHALLEKITDLPMTAGGEVSRQEAKAGWAFVHDLP